MLRNSNKSGFTIIEVVITIAIGAAVMALVLNAVAGARRSQRNNARSADVNQIAAGVNQYIATRNALPTLVSDVVSSGGVTDSDKFGHYELSSINPASTGTSKKGPVANSGTQISPVAATINGTANLGVDEVVIVAKASCNGTTEYQAGGIREMAIVYKLEGQTNRSCLEI